MPLKPSLSATLVLCAFLPLSAVSADEARPWLLGDWDGKRAALAEKGIEIEATAAVDVLANVAGGIKRDVATPANFDLAMTVDTGKAAWWNGGTLKLYLLGNAGSGTSANVGALQVASNIEAPGTVKLYEAWYEHRFLDDRLSVLVGLHDLNSEFYVTDSSGVFLNSSFGIGLEVAQVGPSIFPTSAMAARVRFSPTANTYVMGAVYDGVPGDPNDPYGTHVDFQRHDGVFTTGEIGLTGGDTRHYKVALGGWHQTEFDNMITGARGANHGYYALGETDLWRTADGRGLATFTRLGFAEEDRNQTDMNLGAGFSWTGPVAARPTDVAGLAVAYARNGEDFRRANPGAATDGETVLEFTYQIIPLPWLLIQPDVQYFFDPGTDPTLDDALVIGLRVQVAL